MNNIVKVKAKNPYYAAVLVDDNWMKNPPEYAYKSHSGAILVGGIPIDPGDWIFIDVDIYGKTCHAVVSRETFDECYEVVDEN